MNGTQKKIAYFLLSLTLNAGCSSHSLPPSQPVTEAQAQPQSTAGEPNATEPVLVPREEPLPADLPKKPILSPLPAPTTPSIPAAPPLDASCQNIPNDLTLQLSPTERVSVHRTGWNWKFPLGTWFISPIRVQIKELETLTVPHLNDPRDRLFPGTVSLRYFAWGELMELDQSRYAEVHSALMNEIKSRVSEECVRDGILPQGFILAPLTLRCMETSPFEIEPDLAHSQSSIAKWYLDFDQNHVHHIKGRFDSRSSVIIPGIPISSREHDICTSSSAGDFGRMIRIALDVDVSDRTMESEFRLFLAGKTAEKMQFNLPNPWKVNFFTPLGKKAIPVEWPEKLDLKGREDFLGNVGNYLANKNIVVKAQDSFEQNAGCTLDSRGFCPDPHQPLR
ncbi:hypothetical protein WDW37_13705 [Bdellovibrionota bacterium FG-1]